MSWLERNHIKVKEFDMICYCDWCNEVKHCFYHLQFPSELKESFCCKDHLEKYCAQMKDMII